MAKRRNSEMTLAGWLDLANSASVRDRIASDNGLDDFQAIVRVVARRDGKLDWDEAVAILHMVYGWMPTMLRPILHHPPVQRNQLITALHKARAGDLLERADLEIVQNFANRSVVGASKLLHVLNPKGYVIWDSRVAEVFMWSGVTLVAYSTVDRFVEYLSALQKWSKSPEVVKSCGEIRSLNQALSDASDLRMMELVLFRGKE